MNLKPLTNNYMKYKNVGSGRIEGYWNEDNHPFIITCPVQLQDQLLYVLNNLEKKDINISKSTSADTRSAERKVSKKELLENSKQHVLDVQQALEYMCSVLRQKAHSHDWTKIEFIDEFFNNFKFIQDGNTGDFKNLNWYKKHILLERHHLNDKCPDDVDLFDVLEKIADIVMAGLARTGEVYDDKIDDKILQVAYKNTIEKIKKVTRLINNVKQKG